MSVPRRPPARVFVVDDHPVTRAGICGVLERDPGLTVCGEAGDARSTLQDLDGAAPDVLVVDLELEDVGGIELIKHVHARRPDLPVLVFTMLHGETYAWRALKAGASGFLQKSSTPAELRRAVHSVLAGGLVLRKPLADRMLRDAATGHADDPHLQLTDRELEVFALVGRGLSTRRVASQLGISVRTAESHKTNIRAKLGLADSTELVRAAVLWTAQEHHP